MENAFRKYSLDRERIGRRGISEAVGSLCQSQARVEKYVIAWSVYWKLKYFDLSNVKKVDAGERACSHARQYNFHIGRCLILSRR
jgi:hypothetical protein